MSTTSLAGKVAIVTGGSRGIGAQTVLELASRGAKVAFTYTSDSSAAKAEETVSKITALDNGASAIAIKADLKDLSAPQKIVDATLAAFSGDAIDILVNNAGEFQYKHLSDVTPADYASVYDLNVRAVVFMTQAVLPHLRAPGRIISIGSIASRVGFAGSSIYASSKAALEALGRNWACELGKEGHTVNTVHPGPTETDMMAGAPQGKIMELKEATPVMNRLGKPDDVAKIVAFLASEESRWVSGQAISASGGLMMI